MGWVEQIRIKAEDIEALKKADEMMEKLENVYPILDDFHYSDMQHAEYSRYAEEDKESLADFLQEVFSVPEELREDLLDLAFYLNYEEQSNNGEQSCFNHNIYNFRNTGDFETRNLERHLTSMVWDRPENMALHYLASVLDLELKTA